MDFLTIRNAVALALDVTDEAQWVHTMARIRKRYGRLNVAVNCAGINIARSFPTDTTLADWRHLMAVNLDGVFLGTEHAVSATRDSDPVNGSIINISSIMGLVGLPDIAAYNASKGGVRLYSKSVALSCAERKLNIWSTRCTRVSSTPRCCSRGWRALRTRNFRARPTTHCSRSGTWASRSTLPTEFCTSPRASRGS